MIIRCLYFDRQIIRLYSFNIHDLMSSDLMDSCSIEIYQLQNGFEMSQQSQQLCCYDQAQGEEEILDQKNTPTIKDIIQKGKKKRRYKSRGKLSRIISKTKTQKEAEYKKNICGYIIKKVLREFIYGSYKKYVQEMCETQHVDYEIAQNFYDNKIEGITGPSHLASLFTSQKKEEIPMMRVFWKFCMWFLKQRYVRHLMMEGKMQAKKVYVDYKNRKLIPMISQFQSALMFDTQNLSTINIGEFNSIL